MIRGVKLTMEFPYYEFVSIPDEINYRMDNIKLIKREENGKI